MKKHYGIHRTHLQLTEKAEAYYNNTDPLDIWEWDTANGYRYTMTGADEIDDLVTESFLNDYLESLADAVAEAEADEISIGMTYDDPEGKWEVIGFNGDDVIVRCIDSKAKFNSDMSVSRGEVVYFLTHDWQTGEEK